MSFHMFLIRSFWKHHMKKCETQKFGFYLLQSLFEVHFSLLESHFRNQGKNLAVDFEMFEMDLSTVVLGPWLQKLLNVKALNSCVDVPGSVI